MVKLWEDNTLVCDNCGESLLDPKPHGLYAMVQDEKHVTSVYACCKGKCDKILEQRYGWGGWSDISDLAIPTIWLSRWMAVINGIVLEGESYDAEAYKRLRHVFRAVFPYVSRELTKYDKERVRLHFELSHL